MALETRTPPILRFGTFEVDLRAGELRKQGKLIKLQDQPFQVLSVLLQRPCDVVTREELRSQIWPEDTFVDFDNSLNTAINKLREALGDSADSPRFIETMPRRGYRFLALVSNDGRREPEIKAFGHKIVLPATFAVLLMAAAIGGLYWRSSRARVLTEKDTIVLADFTNTTGDPVFDDTLKQGLRVQLEQSPFLNVLSDQKVSEELQMMGREKDERLTVSIAFEVCQRAGSKAILVGSISSLGKHYAIGMNALSCHTGDNLSSQQVEAESRERVLKKLGDAATKMRDKLGESLATIQKYDVPLEQATTTSLEALKAYTLGLNTVDTKGEEAAIPFFQQATDLDPEFAMAHAKLGALYSATSRAPQMIEKTVLRAYDLRGKATERERLYIEAHYYRDVTGELDKAASIWEIMRQTYPRESVSYSNLAGYHAWRGDYEKALEEAQEALRLYPRDQDGYSTLAWIYMCLNRLHEVEATLKQAEALKLEGENLLGNRYQLAFLSGDTEEMERLAVTVAGRESAEISRVWQAWVEAYHGRLRKARELFPPAKQSAQPCVYLSLIEAYFAATQQARLDADAAMKAMKPNVDRDSHFPLLPLALAMAIAGDVTRAEKLSAGVAKDQPLRSQVKRDWLPTIQAATALARKNPEEAIDLLRPMGPYELGVLQLIPVYERARAYLMLHNGSAAVVEFRKIVDHAGIVGTFPIGALAHLGMGRAYALQGDIAKARAAYQDFLTLWKDADSDLPILQQAKAEYAKLQ